MSENGIRRCWDHEDCPHRWCDGELQQQDRFNVMCLECELVWTHVRYPPTHTEPPKDQLTDADGEVWAEKRAVATDGGEDAIVGSARLRTDGGETTESMNSDSDRSGRSVEAQMKCDCGERDLVVTWTDAVEVGERTDVKMPCSDCGSLERTVTVVYDPDEYDLVDSYGDGDIGLISECMGCRHEYYGPMLRPCYECGGTAYDRYLDAVPEQNRGDSE